jgi:hypothetical protein
MMGLNRKADAAIVSLLYLLLPEITELWWDTVALSDFLRRGGVTSITPEQLRKALFASLHLTAAMP